MRDADIVLAVDDVSLAFGGIRVLANVSFDVALGEIAGLIGANGAGKATCFNCITGPYRPTSGRIVFCGDDLRRRAAHEIAGRGIVRTFQNVALFGAMSVLDNVLVGASARTISEARARREARDALAYLRLEAFANTRASALSYGTRKAVELARAVVARPKLLLLDEPAAGLDRAEVAALERTVRAIRDDLAMTVLVVEHDMGLVMRACDRIVVLDSGCKIAEGSPETIQNDPAVTDAYLGVA